jgi:hypothetical protein
VQLHDIRSEVWCGASARRIIGPVCFYETVDSDPTVQDTLETFLEQMTYEESRYGYFQQYGATSHIENNSLRALWEVFDNGIINTRFWPLRSPDLSVCDFHLWSNFKGKVYRYNPLASCELTLVAELFICLDGAHRFIWYVVATNSCQCAYYHTKLCAPARQLTGSAIEAASAHEAFYTAEALQS